MITVEVVDEGLSPVPCRHRGCDGDSTELVSIAGDAASGMARFCDEHVKTALEYDGLDP
ncbi:MAG TPA: hypothetical protein VFJ06_00285 [Halococcus sp.]|nr:hypothetical protein [Halococcus sp.]